MVSAFIRTAHPFFLLSVCLLYILGIGMARYLGINTNLSVVLLGLLWLSALQLSVSYLHSYFNYSDQNIFPSTEDDRVIRASRSMLLFTAYAFMAVVASLTVFIIRVIENPSVILLMAGLVLGGLSYVIPPFRLSSSGYGELVLAVLVADLTPAWGYQLQGGDSVRLLAMATFPLTALHIAMSLVFSLASYASDLKYNRRTLIIRIGWQNGIHLHNLLILFTYLLFILAITFGLAWQVGAPVLLTLPVGIIQIGMVNRIASGSKPQWSSLIFMAGALFIITVYLLTFGFWVR